ncbi:MAG: FKBP-type peptidyl-prolyl cis-trans isomerase [Chitinophagaceae bacterium]
MKKTINVLLLSFLLFGAGSCIKNEGCQDKTVLSEQATMNAYAASNGITATTHSSGLLYEITNPGSGPMPSPYSTISVKYTGKLLDGTVFDTQTANAITFSLGQAIFGWQLGLPLIRKGGSIKLIIPSSLAYGCAGKSPIPSNAILYFEIQLVDVL